MKNFFSYVIMTALLLTALPQYAYSDTPTLKRQESLENFHKASEEALRGYKKAYIKIELDFFRLKKPKTGALKPLAVLTGYKKKYLILQNDLEEFREFLAEEEKKLLEPFPTEFTEQIVRKYQDSFVAFTSFAKRTLPLLRDELKWVQGQKNATYEVFKNYKAADKFLSKKKVSEAY